MITSAIIIGVSAILVAWIISSYKHRCKHEWEILASVDMKRTLKDYYGGSRSNDYTRYTMKCKKCGELKTYES